MGWDKSAKPKRLRRKHKRMVLWVAMIGSLVLVVFLEFWSGFVEGNAKGSVFEYISGLFSEEEKRAVWDGMTDEGKAVIRKYIPKE